MTRAIDLKDQVALVTGSSQGIGQQTAETLAEAGANVAINYFADAAGKNAEMAEVVVAGINQRVGREAARAFAADVRSV